MDRGPGRDPPPARSRPRRDHHRASTAPRRAGRLPHRPLTKDEKLDRVRVLMRENENASDAVEEMIRRPDVAHKVMANPSNQRILDRARHEQRMEAASSRFSAAYERHNAQDREDEELEGGEAEEVEEEEAQEVRRREPAVDYQRASSEVLELLEGTADPGQAEPARVGTQILLDRAINRESNATARRTSFSSESAERCRSALRAAQVEDANARLEGTVVGGSKVRGVIEIEVEDGEVVVVPVPKDGVTALLASYAERRVAADVHVLTARSPGGREHRSYTLLDLFLREAADE
ncbi:DUF6192 family protein [Streptomyces sp. NPDC006923]|uniref:DUF6192 family protein n=1 Tax=Streptomyces sp. NPDC006923 TaxID=3155355 RepID=UPI0033DBEAD9